jgi:glycosyltransferase involved in cell wall biosynthesis
VSEHTEEGRGSSRWLLRKALVQMADAVTFNGPSCQRYLQRLGVPKHKLYPFPYAADERTDPAGLCTREDQANRRLLVVGQLNERKGILPLLDSLTAYCLQRPGQAWDLTFIGGGPLEQTIRTRDYPSNLRVNVRGFVAPHELAAQWFEYGVLLFPTLADEWGLVVNEALRAGLPVIGSRYAQASTTLIEEGRNGWLYAPDRPTELHAKLELLSQLSSAQLGEMRARARASVAHITSSAAAQNACDMFRALLTSGAYLPAT